MDIFTILIVFFFMSAIIKIATDNVQAVFKPFGDIQAYKLIIALVLTGAGVIGLNLGILELLEIPVEASRPWFHIFDLLLTILFLTSGSQAIHKLADAWKAYQTPEEVVDDDIS